MVADIQNFALRVHCVDGILLQWWPATPRGNVCSSNKTTNGFSLKFCVTASYMESFTRITFTFGKLLERVGMHPSMSVVYLANHLRKRG